MSFAEALNVVLTAVLTAVVGAFIAFTKRTLTEFRFIKNSQRVMVKDRIVQAHDYFIEKGSIGKYSLSTIEELYSEYDVMGGNGFVKGLMEDIRKIPIR